MQRVAMLSVHTSPLAQPGTGDGGGMNVYVRALGSALARAGVARRRADARRAPRATTGRRGRARLPGAARRRPGPCAPVRLRELPELVGEFTDASHRLLEQSGALRRAARELLGVGRGRPPPQARARPPAGHHLPHARPGQGRGRSGRRRAAATTRRSGGRALRRPRRRFDARGAGPARASLRRRSRARSRSSRRASTTRCSSLATAATARRHVAPPPTGRSCSSSAACNR